MQGAGAGTGDANKRAKPTPAAWGALGADGPSELSLLEAVRLGIYILISLSLDVR